VMAAFALWWVLWFLQRQSEIFWIHPRTFLKQSSQIYTRALLLRSIQASLVCLSYNRNLMMGMEHFWNCTEKEKQRYSKKNLFSVPHFLTQKSHSMR
jgi:hypothetical protein